MVDVSDIIRFDNLEDRLTAQFVATLQHSQWDYVLKPFLRTINFDLDLEEDLKDVKFGL